MGGFYKWLKKEEFTPSKWGMLVNSSYLMRSELAEAIRRHRESMRGVMLDFGCGRAPYKEYFEIDQYLGLEIAAPGHPLKNSHATILYSGNDIPLEDGSVDCVLMTEVLEHVFNPNELLREIHRVLRPEGRLLITCPFVWPLHEEPFDYARYTPFALRDLIERSGLEFLSVEKYGSWVQAVAQLVLVYVVQTLLPKNERLNRIGRVLSSAMINPVATLMHGVLPENDRFYLGNVLLAAKR